MSCRKRHRHRYRSETWTDDVDPRMTPDAEPDTRKGSPFDSPNPHRLYRSDRRLVGGVAAGVAEYVGVKPWLARAGLIVALALWQPVALIGYLIAWVVIPRRPASPAYRDAEEERFWRSVALEPKVTLDALRLRFQELEQRMVSMEATVTAPEYDLNRRIRDLEP